MVIWPVKLLLQYTLMKQSMEQFNKEHTPEVNLTAWEGIHLNTHSFN